MTWTETHRRMHALQQIEERARRTGEPELPWDDELAAIFGDRDTLAEALRYRWRLARDAQLDSHLPERALEDNERRLAARFGPVLRMIEAHDATAYDGPDRVPA